MRRQSLGTTLGNLDGALRFCESLGLAEEVAASRFSQYRSHLAHLERTLVAHDLTALDNAFQATRHLSMVALTESTEFGGIMPSLGFVQADQRTLREKFVQLLSGPVMPEEEDQNTNQGRNILFELNLASKLSRVGIETYIDAQADLCFDWHGRRILVECKRPFSHKTVRGKFAEARDQLLTNLAAAPRGSGGVVALSVSRVVNPAANIAVESTAEGIRRRLGKQMMSVSRELFGHSPGASNLSISGVLFHVTTPALSLEDQLWAVTQETILQPLTPLGSQDFELMRGLAGTLDEKSKV